MAIGSEVGQYPRGADGLTDLDRHEVAHCVITRNYTARSDPPRVLMEGWAQANQGTPAEELAETAWDDHEKGRSLTLRQLVAPDWYWYSGPAAYNQGAPLVNYLLRVYGPERFLKLYTTCQQATFEADCRATLGIGLDELDAAFWADTEQIARRAGPPARRWLKGLKLDPSIDPAAWDAFLADYFAAADRLVAPYDHVRMTTTFRIESGDQGRQRRSVRIRGAAHLAPLGSVRPRPASGRRSARGRSWPTPTTRSAPSATSAPSSGPGRSRKTPRPPRCKPTGEPWARLSRRRAINAFVATHGGADLAGIPSDPQGDRLLDRLRSRQAATPRPTMATAS